ncbi:hypothetical protein LPJ66_003259 [Kickxella alabastrina]|uniref:Uncharacterized protein n=1 Tax=Kickxella alabastrina TaxID=61397 RepID=A0ACC1INB2_9FUNG|nr:hypothetical protein LPJ66_003259 [Kickxella alabastrina]
MLSYAAVGRLRIIAADSTRLGLNHISKAAYHHHSHHGKPLRSGNSKWVMRLMNYLRTGFSAFASGGRVAPIKATTAAGRLFAKTAAARLGARPHLRTVYQRLLYQTRLTPRDTSRIASRAIGFGRWAFGSGGRWSPYLRTVSQAMRSLSGPNNIASARVVMAQLQRQALVVGSLSQQRRDYAAVSPLAYGTRISMPFSKTQPTAAATRLAAKNTTTSGISPAASSENAESNASVGHQQEQKLHPVAQAAQEAAIPIEQCVTITIPYSIMASSQPPYSVHQQPSELAPLANVAQLIADVQRVQQRHTLLLSRLTERLAGTGWNVQYHHVATPTESLRIALPPLSGINTAAALEALLCEWGFDTSLFAATIRDPLVPLPAATAAVTAPNTACNTKSSSSSAMAGLYNSEDIDSRLFSLIVDQVVDPEEAYREDVRDFLTQIEQMPHLSHRRLHGGC